MNSLMIVCLGLYTAGVGAQRPDAGKDAPVAEPAGKARGPAFPGFPNGAPGGLPFPVMPPNVRIPGANGVKPMPGPMFQAGRGLPGGAPNGFPFAGAGEDLPKDLVPTLIEALKDKDQDIRKYVTSSLVRIGKEAVEPLTELLKGKDKSQRANAAYILGQIGAAARGALPLLVKALKDDDKDVRLRAAFAIERLLAAPGNNQMAMGMPGGMPMGFNPMAGMMGNRPQKTSVALPADPGPVAPSADNAKPAKEIDKKPSTDTDKKPDAGSSKKPEKAPEKKLDE